MHYTTYTIHLKDVCLFFKQSEEASTCYGVRWSETWLFGLPQFCGHFFVHNVMNTEQLGRAAPLCAILLLLLKSIMQIACTVPLMIRAVPNEDRSITWRNHPIFSDQSQLKVWFIVLSSQSASSPHPDYWVILILPTLSPVYLVAPSVSSKGTGFNSLCLYGNMLSKGKGMYCFSAGLGNYIVFWGILLIHCQ